MSDGLPPGAVDLEADPNQPGTPVGIVSDPAIPLDPNAAPAEEAQEDEPEGTFTMPAGGKFVPLEAAQSARQAAKEAKAALAAREQEIAALQEKATRYDQTKAYLDQVKPVIDKVIARPDILRLADQPPQVQEPAGPLTPQEAIEYAKDFDLYTTDGKPDVERAQRIAKRHEAMSGRVVSQAVQPLNQYTAQQQAQLVRHRIASAPGAPSAASLEKVTSFLPAELMSQPGVDQLAFLVAKGLDAVNTPPKTTPPPVVPTEGIGGPPKAEPTITDLDRKVMEYAGLSKKQFEAAAARFRPGQNNSLE